MGRTKANVNPPAAVPQLTGADTQSQLSVATGAPFHSCVSCIGYHALAASTPIGLLIEKYVQPCRPNIVSTKSKSGFTCVSCGTHPGGRGEPRVIRQNANPARAYDLEGARSGVLGTLMTGLG